MTLYIRKDCTPEQTIDQIQMILKSHRIEVIEQNFAIGKRYHSIRVSLKAFPRLGTNGKGVTQELARASAYAELMERLQGRLLIKPYFLGKENNYDNFVHDRKLSEQTFFRLYKKQLDFLSTGISKEKKDAFEQLLRQDPTYRYSSHFKELGKGNFTTLPISIINMLTHSNGLCAGNTEAEATAQGICEIFERYCHKEIIKGGLNLPILRSEKIDTTSLEELNSFGFSYAIKDCSLGGKFPVVGLVLYSENRDKYLFGIGADINIQIALDRCITEIFQGMNCLEDIWQKMKPTNEYSLPGEINIHHNWMNAYTLNNGRYNEGIFSERRESDLSDLPFRPDIICNEEALHALVSIVEKQGNKVYSKDLSYLGFPTYKIYIPGLSEIENVDEININLVNGGGKAKSAYFNFTNASRDDISLLANFSYEMTKKNKDTYFEGPDIVFKTQGCEHSSLFLLSYEQILALTYLKMGEYEKFLKVIQRNNDLAISLMLPNFQKYEEGYIDKISKYIDEYDYWKRLDFPICPNCKKCRISVTCPYPEWKKIDRLIRKSQKVYPYVVHDSSNKMFIRKLRGDITECRIIQLENDAQ